MKMTIEKRIEKELKELRKDMDLYMKLMERNSYYKYYEEQYMKAKMQYELLKEIKGDKEWNTITTKKN